MNRELGGWLMRVGFAAVLAVVSTAPASAGHFWDMLTHKKPAAAGTCNSAGCCKPAPAAVAVPGAAVPATAQPYMVPIGPPRLVPATPGASASPPSLSPSGASISSGSPAVVARPVLPSSQVVQNPYPFAVPSANPTARAAYYQPAATPAVVAQSPAVAAPAGHCPSCQQPVVVNYAPNTAYRNKAVQVPVTMYRPVAGIDPRTGAQVTVLQPCQVTTTQVQRVPTMFSRSFARTYQPIPVSGTVVTSPAVVAAPAAVSSPQVVAPSYVVPAAAWGAPVTAPATTLPYVPANGGSMPSNPATPRALEPADQAPSLSSSGNLSPTTNSGASFRTSIPSSPRRSIPNSESVGQTPARSNAPSTNSTDRLELPPPPEMPLNVRPIPLPEADSPANRVPDLIKPPVNGRTAATDAPQQRLNASEIRRTNRREVPAVADAAKRWDDSGWRSLAP